jgi:hypothetical protein
MFEVNVTGVFMTAQAVAKQMIRFGNGGSIALIASMSGTIVNRVCSSPFSPSYPTPCQSNISHDYGNLTLLDVSPPAFHLVELYCFPALSPVPHHVFSNP